MAAGLTLGDFRAIAGSESSIGYVALKVDGATVSLQKIDNHKHLTSKNVQIANAAPAANRQVREAFYRAIASAFGDKQGNHADYLSSVRRQLGLDDRGLAPDESAEPSKPLDRRTVRALTQATDALLKNGLQVRSSGKLTDGQKELDDFVWAKSDGATLDEGLIFGLYEGLTRMKDEKLSDVWCAGIGSGESIHLTRLKGENGADGLVRIDLGKKTYDLEPKAFSRLRWQCAFAAAVRDGALDVHVNRVLSDIETLFAKKVNDFTAWTGRMSDDVCAIRDICQKLIRRRLGELVSDEKLATVSPHLMSRLASFVCVGGRKDLGKDELKELADAVTQEIDRYCAPRLTSVEVQDLMARYEQAQPGEKNALKPPEPNPNARPKASPDPVQLLLADIVSDAKTFLRDRHPIPGERLRLTLQTHQDALVELLLHPDEKIRQLSAPAQEFARKLIGKIEADPEINSVVSSGPLALKLALTMALLSNRSLGALAEIEKALDEEMMWMCRKMQHRLMGSLDQALKPKRGASENERAEEAANDGYDEMVDALRNVPNVSLAEKEALLETIDLTLEALMQAKVSQTDLAESIGLLRMWFGGGLDLKWAEHVQYVNTLLRACLDGRAREARDLEPEKIEVKGALAYLREHGISVTQDKPVLDASRELLDRLADDGNLDRGYGAFMKKVMWRYLRQMPIVDKRAMLAAGIRFSGVNDDEMQQLAASMKGAGPIMQKMLQGLASMDIDAAFAKSLEDMKSNLPEIPKDVVDAYLLEVVRQSKGAITEIRPVKTLGTASVGQTVLCRVKCAKAPQDREIVVKMLRPEIEARLEHEKALFLQAAKEVPGMERTFAEQLESIIAELDFSIEARNVDGGQVYDAGARDVKAMKLLNLIKPTKRLLVLEKAPGDDVSTVVRNAHKELDDLMADFFYEWRNDATGQPVLKLKEQVDEKRLIEKIPKVLEGLSNQYAKLHAHQKRLVELARKWTYHAIYSDDGYFHGDLHAGNIMVDDEKGLTVIDFGNATRLTSGQQKNVLRMMNAACLRDTNVFMDNFSALMSEEGRQRFEANRTNLHNLIHNILNLGDESNAADRIFAILLQLQQRGFELPGPIFKFSQCAVRLQGTIREVNGLLKRIKSIEAQFRENHPAFASCEGYDRLPDASNPIAFLFGQMTGGNAGQCGPAEIVRYIDKILDDRKKGRGPAALMSAYAVLPPLYASGTMTFELWPTLNKLIKGQRDTLMALLNDNEHIGRIESAYNSLCEKLLRCQAVFANLPKHDPNSPDYVEFKNWFDAYYPKQEDARLQAGLDLLENDKNFLSAYGKCLYVNQRRQIVADKIASLLQQLTKPSGQSDDARKNLNKIHFLETVDCAIDLTTLKADFQINFEACKIALEGLPEVPKATESKYDDMLQEYNRLWTEDVAPAMKTFGDACEAAQLNLLNNLKTALTPMIETDAKGHIVRKVTMPDALGSFASAVSGVIMDHLWSSARKQGIRSIVTALWKSWGPSFLTRYDPDPRE